MDIEKIIHGYGARQPFTDTVHMLLSNCVDYGSESGGLISVKKYPDIEVAIKRLMSIAWEHGLTACTCNECDFCKDYGPDTFERFIKEFSDYC